MSTAQMWAYFLPMALCYIGLLSHIFLHEGPDWDKIPRWVAILWVIFGLAPAVNVFVGLASVIGFFSLKPVQRWLAAPVRKG
jgi:hypothetical protein